MSNQPRNPTRAEVLNQRGIELADRGWFEEALKEFNRAIELDRTSPFPRINRASVLVEQDRQFEALEDLVAAVKMAPNDAATHYHLGLFLSRHGSSLALKELRASLELEPDQIDTLLQIGITHGDRGEFRQAEECIRSALDLDPSDPWVHHEFGVVLTDQGRVHEAISHLRFALRQVPSGPEIALDLAAAYAQAGFLEQAEQVLKEHVLSRDPGDFHGHFSLATICVRQGKQDEALEHLTLAARKNHSQTIEWVADDPAFDALRTDERFLKLKEVSAPPDVV